MLAAGVSLCLLGAAIAVAVALSEEDPASRAATFAGPLMPKNLPAADFTLHDQDGRPVTLSDTRGRVVVLTFLHSLCHSTCPVSVQTIRGALDDIGSARRAVDVLAVTVDPAEDTPAHVRAFLRAQHAAGILRYLTGPRPVVRRVWKRYGIGPQGGGREDHTAFVLLIDRKGILRIGFPSHEMTPEDLANDLRLLVAEQPA
jgi:protein SCO1/2